MIEVDPKVRKLFALSKGEGRCTAKTLVEAAVSLGIDASLHRREGSYSCRMGSSYGNKQPDLIWIELAGKKYGGPWGSSSHNNLRQLDFAEDVVDMLPDPLRWRIEVDYHIQKLKSLGALVQILEDANGKKAFHVQYE